jgi:proline dehydrogenase
VAFERKPDVDANYVKLMKLLLAEGNYPAIASHDEKIIDEAVRHIREQKLDREAF